MSRRKIVATLIALEPKTHFRASTDAWERSTVTWWVLQPKASFAVITRSGLRSWPLYFKHRHLAVQFAKRRGIKIT